MESLSVGGVVAVVWVDCVVSVESVEEVMVPVMALVSVVRMPGVRAGGVCRWDVCGAVCGA
ncbi:MAG: hypothetical protein ABS62_11700 [Microbacterium sp. SCN 70-200]|nr:MAG: hypothetical protein ABS62_11700 [Microbacterium sp. SCN 70-200]OJV81954.1 MAG: hypothetical protein BGO46_08290 [Microbacterium sp. 70-16]